MFSKGVSASGSNTIGGATEEDVLASQEKRTEEEAKVDHLDAKTHDQKTLTALKGKYAEAVMNFLWTWFFAVFLAVFFYYLHQVSLEREIPKEVIISIITSTAVIAGLVGYIVKGLFGTSK